MLEHVPLQTTYVITKLPGRTVLRASISNGFVKDSVCQDWGAQDEKQQGNDHLLLCEQKESLD